MLGVIEFVVDDLDETVLDAAEVKIELAMILLPIDAVGEGETGVLEEVLPMAALEEDSDDEGVLLDAVPVVSDGVVESMLEEVDGVLKLDIVAATDVEVKLRLLVGKRLVDVGTLLVELATCFTTFAPQTLLLRAMPSVCLR